MSSPTAPAEPTFYTTAEVAQMLDISVARVNQAARAHGLGRRLSSGRLYTPEEVEVIRERHQAYQEKVAAPKPKLLRDHIRDGNYMTADEFLEQLRETHDIHIHKMTLYEYAREGVVGQKIDPFHYWLFTAEDLKRFPEHYRKRNTYVAPGPDEVLRKIREKHAIPEDHFDIQQFHRELTRRYDSAPSISTIRKYVHQGLIGYRASERFFFSPGDIEVCMRHFNGASAAATPENLRSS